jgi:ATP synthase protein I
LCCGKSYGISALTGGIIAILPNVFFAYKAFKYAGARSSKLVMESFFLGEKIKMVLTVILLALAFKFLAIVPVPFFTTFCLVMVMPLLTPFLFKL